MSHSADGGSGIESDADYQAAKRVVDEEAAHLRAVIVELKAAAGDRAKLEEIKKAHHARTSAIERAHKGLWDLSEAKVKRLRAYTQESLLPLKKEMKGAWRWAQEFQLGAGERHQPELSTPGIDGAAKGRWETVVRAYPSWFRSFHSDFTRFAERAKQKTPLTGAQIDSLFANSILAGSKMTATLAMFDAKGLIEGSGAEPGYAGMATVLLMLLGNSGPASFGGAVPGEHGDRIYMQLPPGTDNPYTDQPIPRVTERVDYPHVIFQVQGDKLLLTAISKEFAAVMHKTWQRQML
ncbi:MAG: hypothetical protein VYE15_06515 [Myxococcota bacterium]|nr:hypothetical protein [Myxococcota bacterium]